MADPQQRPTTEGSTSEWTNYQNRPKERRVLIVTEFETMYGEAPSGAHESEKRWIIWKEVTDESGRVTREYAQNGANDLRWIHATISFGPQPNGVFPYFIELDNYSVFDGMVAGLPVANVTVYDADSAFHNITVYDDPYDKFLMSGNVLVLKNSVQLLDIAYPLKLKATDPEGNTYVQPITIRVLDPAPPTAGDFIGELNVFEEDSISPALDTDIISYTIPANRSVRMRKIEVFGMNKGNFIVRLNGDILARKETYYTRYETEFDFENYTLIEGDVLTVEATNKGLNTALFNARLRGYQYAV